MSGFSLTNTDVILRISVAFLSGLLIGLERQLNGRTAGIHTCVLVSIGSCLFIFVGYGLGEINSPSRIAAQIVTGIGFIGSGVIIKDNEGVRGINSAGTVWCVGSVGALCGCGFWLTGLCSSILILVCNYILRDAHLKMCLQVLNLYSSKEKQHTDASDSV